jgi:hypothetical protein
MSDSDTQTDERTVQRTTTGHENALQKPGPLSLLMAACLALVLGMTVTALLHDAFASSGPFGGTGATQWSGLLVLFAPLVAAGFGYDVGRNLGGRDAYVTALVGGSVGYLVLYLGRYVINDVLLDGGTGDIDIVLELGTAVGIGVTGLLLAWVVDSYADWN